MSLKQIEEIWTKGIELAKGERDDYDDWSAKYKELLENFSPLLYLSEKLQKTQLDSPNKVMTFLAPLEFYLDSEIDITEIKTQDNIEQRKSFPHKFILHNIRSAYNIGSIIRSAEGLGLRHVYLTGYSSIKGEQEDFSKTALGGDKSITWSYEPCIKTLIDKEKKDSKIFALETTIHSKTIENKFFKSQSCYIFGNEKNGLSPFVLSMADEILQIPLCGNKNSLNVSNAASIIAYKILENNEINHYM